MGKRGISSQHYGRADYGARKQALVGQSRPARRKIAAVFSEANEYSITDTSHLLFAVSLPLTTGDDFQWHFYDPLSLVQYVLDQSSAMKKAICSEASRAPTALAHCNGI